MPIHKDCPTCGISFSFPPSRNQKHCSHKCSIKSGKDHHSWKGGLVERSCGICGSSFSIKPKDIRNGAGKFCSYTCAAKHRGRIASQRAKEKRVHKSCVICGKDIFVKQSHADSEGKYCSISCRSEGYKKSNIFSGSNNPNYRHGNSNVTGFYNHQRRCADGNYGKEDVEKLEVNQKGKCANCNVKLSQTGYHIDHIVPIFLGGSNWPSNLQLLCPSCNCKKNAKHPLEWAKENGRLL